MPRDSIVYLYLVFQREEYLIIGRNTPFLRGRKTTHSLLCCLICKPFLDTSYTNTQNYTHQRERLKKVLERQPMMTTKRDKGGDKKVRTNNWMISFNPIFCKSFFHVSRREHGMVIGNLVITQTKTVTGEVI